MFKVLAILLCIWTTSPLFAGTKLRFSTGDIDPLLDSRRLETFPKSAAPQKPSHYIVQFLEIPRPKLLKQLARYGKFLHYFPDNAYIAKMTPEQADALRSHPRIRWIGVYQSSFKYGSDLEMLGFSTQESLIVRADLFKEADLKQTQAAIQNIGGRVLKVFIEPSTRLRIEIPPAGIAQLADVEDIQWIEIEGKREARNSTTRWVIQSNATNNTSVWDHGIHGEGQIAGHIDFLIDSTSCYLDQPGKIVTRHNDSGGSIVAHGMNTAGTLVGDKIPYGTPDPGDGNAFAARITHRNLNDLDSQLTLYTALQTNHSDGARVHSNSWGDDTTSSYTQDCRDADRFASEREDDLVVFAVTNLATLKSPENAKNVLAVGASQQAPNQANRCAGGSGPTEDGRRKPEIYAPGCGIVTANTTACSTSTVSGTSLAAPAVSAAALLARQYFMSGFYPTGSANAVAAFTPTGALLKATLLNGAVDMTGVSGYPGNVEGWGRLLLENALFFAGDSRKLIVRDIRHSSGFSTGSTSSQNYTFGVASGDALRVTLVWTDVEAPPSAHGGLINDLDLEVTTSNGVFKGNVFSGGQSISGGTFDGVNNVEQVLLSNPATGTLSIRVIGSGIPDGPQGYALVVSGNISEGAPPPPTNILPTATVVAPLTSAFYVHPATTALQATATDSDGTINKVEFYAGTNLVGTDTTNPYQATVSLNPGDYAVTSKSYDNSGGIKTSTAVQITIYPASNAIPAPWQQSEIGGPAGPGNGIFSTNGFTVNGAGSDIWSSNDSFHYVYQPLSGNGEIIARVASQQNTNSWAKAGVMIRSTLAANSANAAMLVSPSNGLAFQRRVITGGTSANTSGGPGTAPYWVKIARTGNTFTGSRSTNGTNWTIVGTTTITMGTNVFIGLAVTSHNINLLSTAVFDNVSLGGAPPPTNNPPSVNITTPANGATFTAPATFDIDANASDNDGTITQVEFFNGSTSLGTDTTPSPYRFTWSNVPAGTYTLTAKATDNLGAFTISSPVTVTVESPGGGGALPAPWLNTDVGNVGVAGNASYASGSFTLNGAGNDIWNGVDSFHYVYQPLIGDGEIVARVVSQQNTNTWAKTGVMIRQSFSANSQNATMLITVANGLKLQSRATAGASSTAISGGTGTAPYWVKLVRTGSTFTGYKSVDGINWITVGSVSINMASNIYIGLAHTSHNTSVLGTAVFDNVSVIP